MVAKISFIVYQDYSQYLTHDNDYTDALNALNKHLKELVDNKKLTFKYREENVKPILPLTMEDVGNIFKDDLDDFNWDAVEIGCEIDFEESDFTPEDFIVDECPNHFDPVMVLYS